MAFLFAKVKQCTYYDHHEDVEKDQEDDDHYSGESIFVDSDASPGHKNCGSDPNNKLD